MLSYSLGCKTIHTASRNGKAVHEFFWMGQNYPASSTDTSIRRTEGNCLTHLVFQIVHNLDMFTSWLQCGELAGDNALLCIHWSRLREHMFDQTRG